MCVYIYREKLLYSSFTFHQILHMIFVFLYEKSSPLKRCFISAIPFDYLMCCVLFHGLCHGGLCAVLNVSQIYVY